MSQPKKRNADPRCSFCSKAPSEVAQFVNGPGAIGICDECVALCVEIVQDGPPKSSKIQQSTIVLEDGTRHLVVGGLRETVTELGTDDLRLVAFDLVDGARIAVRRQAVRQVHADAEPEEAPREPPEWARSAS